MKASDENGRAPLAASRQQISAWAVMNGRATSAQRTLALADNREKQTASKISTTLQAESEDGGRRREISASRLLQRKS